MIQLEVGLWFNNLLDYDLIRDWNMIQLELDYDLISGWIMI